MMLRITGKNFIGFKRGSEGKVSLKSFNPSNNCEINHIYNLASQNELDDALLLADRASKIYMKKTGIEKAEFLDAIAKAIMRIGDDLIKICTEETGLAEERIIGERDRTCKQLHLFSEILRAGTWIDARIDPRIEKRSVDIRRMLVPIGPIAVFGASNFPLAFSVAGGDTASAFAAGCTVIFKAHPYHPGTSELVANAIIQAAKETGMPSGIFSMLHLSNEEAIRLVKNHTVKAVAFTGSREVGLILMDAVKKRKEPIPVFAEMSSSNPVILMPNALLLRAEEIARELVSSITASVGQFCTNPGLILLIEGKGTDIFLNKVSLQIANSYPGTMLSKGILKAYLEKVKILKKIAGVSIFGQSLVEADIHKNEASPAVFKINGKDLLDNTKLFDEIFGPVSLFIVVENEDELLKVLHLLPGQLTATVHALNDDKSSLLPILELATSKVGRIIWGGFPTGVQVSHAMHHGGPFPSTSNEAYTSVGSAAIQRFVRPIAFQNFPDEFLPLELKNFNPLNIIRLVNGKFSNEIIKPQTLSD